MSEDTEARRNPPWNRDELVLALDVFLKLGDSEPRTQPALLEALEADLRALHDALGTTGKSTLRNSNGVYMKLMNFRRFDPRFANQGHHGLPHGSRLEEEVWLAFQDQPLLLQNVATAIRDNLHHATGKVGPPIDSPDDELDGDVEAIEGRILTVEHHRRERARKVTLARKAAEMKAHGRLACEVCRFDFAERYGSRGEGFIECHHTRPLADLRAGARTSLKDLALVCANCHRMIHARRPWLTIDELRAQLKGP